MGLVYGSVAGYSKSPLTKHFVARWNHCWEGIHNSVCGEQQHKLDNIASPVGSFYVTFTPIIQLNFTTQAYFCAASFHLLPLRYRGLIVMLKGAHTDFVKRRVHYSFTFLAWILPKQSAWDLKPLSATHKPAYSTQIPFSNTHIRNVPGRDTYRQIKYVEICCIALVAREHSRKGCCFCFIWASALIPTVLFVCINLRGKRACLGMDLQCGCHTGRDTNVAGSHQRDGAFSASLLLLVDFAYGVLGFPVEHFVLLCKVFLMNKFNNVSLTYPERERESSVYVMESTNKLLYVKCRCQRQRQMG